MPSETNREKLDRFNAAFGRGDRATMSSLLHPDFKITEAESLPYAGIYRGEEGWWRLVDRITQTWSDLKVTPQFILGKDEGDRFGAMHRMQGKSIATGRELDTRVFEVWSFRDGLIVDVQPHYWDTQAVAALTAPSTAAA